MSPPPEHPPQREHHERANTKPETEPAGPFITREHLATLPVRRYEGPIHLIARDDQLPSAVEKLRAEKILGFDIETRPSFRVGEIYPPALLQLCGENAAYVIQLLKLNHVGPLLEILADKTITKAGVALTDDLKKLRTAYDFHPAGFTDIGHTAKSRGYKQTGLRALCGLHFHFRMSKREQRSNWAAQTLTPGQINYAATDAWASRELFLAFRDGKEFQPLEKNDP